MLIEGPGWLNELGLYYLSPIRCGFASGFVNCLGPLALVLLFPKLKIIWLSNISILSVPDEGYSRNESCALSLIFTFLLLVHV